MKIAATLFALVVVTACSPTGKETATAPDTTVTPAPAAQSEPAPSPAASTASATGVVEGVDPVAKTITIAHGAVESLKWPAMTMTFKAGDVDLSSIKQGDRVSFEFTSTGMDGTVTSLTLE